MADKTELLIELGVDGSKAEKQISAINKEIKSMDKELKSLDTSTDDFNKNMQNMAKYVDLTKNKISALELTLEKQNECLTKAKTKLADARKAQEEYNNGSKKSAGGYLWKYLDSNNNIIAEGKGKTRTILQRNEDIV